MECVDMYPPGMCAAQVGPCHVFLSMWLLGALDGVRGVPMSHVELGKRRCFMWLIIPCPMTCF